MNWSNPLLTYAKLVKIYKLHLKIKKGDNTSAKRTKQTNEQIT